MKHYKTPLPVVGAALIGAVTVSAGIERTTRASQAPPHSPAKVIKRAAMRPYSLPVCIEPTAEQFANIEILDANADGKTWKRQEYGQGYFKYDYNSNQSADDWVFIPVTMTAEDNFITLSVESRVQDAQYAESFEIGWGTSTDPMVMQVVLEKNDIKNTVWETSTTSFSIPTSGTVYIGLHATSAKDKYGLWVRNISLSALTTPMPLAPQIAESSIDGLSYTAQVMMPTSTVQGKVITDPIELIVAVDDAEVNRLSGNPGEAVDVALTLEKGTHVITYTVALTAGGETQLSDSVSDSVRASDAEPIDLPVFIEPTADQFNLDCFVIDSNNDGSTWEYSTSEGALQYYYNSSNAADDWFFLPPINFGPKGGAFDLSIDAKVAAAYSPESFEVCVGRTASTGGMTPMLACNNIKNTIWENYTGKITLSEGGTWYVAVHCTSDADQYSLYVRNISITGAPDNTPAIPVVKSIDFNGTEGSITYTLPAVTVENKELSLPVGLIVTADGALVTRTEPAAAGSDVTVPMTLALGNHTITATAFVADGDEELSGSPVVSNIIISNPEGYVYQLPFMMRPTAGEFQTLTTLDANDSGINWDYNSGADNGNGAMVCRTRDDKVSDAWVFFPKVAITDVNKIYTVSAQARAYLEQFPEDFDICIGTEASPAAMTVVASADDYTSYLYSEVAGEYTAPAAGEYVIGIHRRSGVNAHTLSVHSVGISDSGKSTMAPGVATDLTAEAEPTGVAAATISFNMPLVSISGTALDANTDLTATVTGATGQSATVTGKPGERVSVRVAGADGYTSFTVVVSSEEYGSGNTVSVNAYCGFDKPSAPAVSHVGSADNLTMTITWVDATVGANGGAVNPALLSHNIYIPADATGEYWSLIAEVPAGTDSYVYSVEDYALLDIAYVGVVAVNDKGMSDLGLTYDVLGTPYPLPIGDDFATGRYLYSPLVTPTPTAEYCPDWFFDDPGLLIPSLSGKNLAALFCANTAESGYKHAMLTLPKFSTEGAPTVKLTLDLYAASTTPSIVVLGDTYTAKGVEIGTIDAKSGNDWRTVEMTLPAEMNGQKWVALSLRVDFGEGSEAFILKEYTVTPVFEKELQVELQSASQMIVGDTYEVVAYMTNRAETAETLPEVKCTLGDTVLEASSVPEATSIQAGETLRFVYNITPTAEMIGEHWLKFELVNYTDQVADNNVAENIIAITAGDKPIVTDLTGDLNEAGIPTLTWTAPEIKLTGNDDIESYDGFDFSTNLGQWLNIDRDGKEVYGLGTGVVFEGQYEPKAFQVIDVTKMPSGTVRDPFSGDKYLMAITPTEGAADDWLISPEVVGGSKVSFRLNILSENYGAESVDVLYSTTGRNPEDFTLLKTFSQARIAWNPLEVTLPADARYFAFHYRCEDIFGICLDDIFYSPITDNSIAGYNIYKNGDRVVERYAETTYEITDGKMGDKFNVAVVTENGGKFVEQPLSNTYILNKLSGIDSVESMGSMIAGQSGSIRIDGFGGMTASVYTADGALVARADNLDDAAIISVPAGLYLVKVGTITVKVIVR